MSMDIYDYYLPNEPSPRWDEAGARRNVRDAEHEMIIHLTVMSNDAILRFVEMPNEA